MERKAEGHVAVALALPRLGGQPRTKRSTVKDSHDRYANVETASLMKRIARFKGLVVLATNRRTGTRKKR